MKIPVLILHDYSVELPREMVHQLRVDIPHSCHTTVKGILDFTRDSMELRSNTGVIKLFRKYLPEQTEICYFSLEHEVPVISLAPGSNREIFSTRKK